VPRVNLDSSVFTDPRFAYLARKLGLADGAADLGVMAMARVWLQCTERGSHSLPGWMIDELLGKGAAAKVVDAELAEPVTESLLNKRSTFVGEVLTLGEFRLRGTFNRIEWLERNRRNAAEGGKRRNADASRGAGGRYQPDGSSTNQPSGTESPPAVASAPAPAPAPRSEDLKNVELGSSTSPGLGREEARRERRRKRLHTEAELADVAVVLAKLSDRSGVAYRGGELHAALIVRHLRAGLTRWDLRRVIAHCADMWQSDPKMVRYLRPETLFGPVAIERYLDAARSAYPGEEPPLTASESEGDPTWNPKTATDR
jgi:uncharacterized phage protein (TIGR02220 family)